MGKVKIYLSPSRQPGNLYATGNTNEEKEMVKLSKRIKNILDEEYFCETHLATLSLDIGAEGRPKEAKEKNCDIYLAIHSNAGGKGKASGAVALYHPKRPDSKLLAEYLVMELNSICPIKSNRSEDLVDGMAAFQGKGYGEIRVPAKLGMTPVLMETNFHDHPAISEWMTINTETMARAYVKALVRFLGLPVSTQAAETVKEEDSEKLYRVQVGAFRKKENAEILALRLLNEGFEGFIKFC